MIDGNVWGPDGLHAARVRVDNRKISEVVHYHELADGIPIVTPGFVDMHVHGGGGADTMDATPEAFRTIAQTHARHGTTGLLLTTVTERPFSVFTWRVRSCTLSVGARIGRTTCYCRTSIWPNAGLRAE